MGMARLDIAGTQNRILDQYRASPRLLALFAALIDNRSADIRATLSQMLLRLDIDAMEGVQLDLIGAIIGRPRPTTLDPILVQVPGLFEFNEVEPAELLIDDDEAALDYDDAPEEYLVLGEPGPSDPDLGFDGLDDILRPLLTGGPFASLSDIPKMTDADYRKLLRATIYLNTSGASVPEIEFYGQFVLGIKVSVNNNFTGIDLVFTRPITLQERAIIEATLLPAAGIAINAFVVETDPDTDIPDGFGFAGLATLTGFGTVGEPQVGSGFARLA
jgi:hypothetical protein